MPWGAAAAAVILEIMHNHENRSRRGAVECDDVFDVTAN